MKVAQNIKRYRELNKLTQKQLAEMLGTKHNTVSAWENGMNSVDITVLVKMCEILNITINEVYGIEEPKKHNVTSNEMNLIRKYQSLDQNGKETVIAVLDLQYNRVCDTEFSEERR